MSVLTAHFSVNIYLFKIRIVTGKLGVKVGQD